MCADDITKRSFDTSCAADGLPRPTSFSLVRFRTVLSLGSIGVGVVLSSQLAFSIRNIYELSAYNGT